MHKRNQHDIGLLAILIVVLIVVVAGFTGWKVWQPSKKPVNFTERWLSCSPGLRVRRISNGDTLESVKAEIAEIKARDARMDCDPDTATFRLTD